jgi:hypothetical protein
VYGCERGGKGPWRVDNAYVRHYVTGGLELVALALDYAAHTGDPAAAAEVPALHCGAGQDDSWRGAGPGSDLGDGRQAGGAATRSLKWLGRAGTQSGRAGAVRGTQGRC